jgi:hypothetical protein
MGSGNLHALPGEDSRHFNHSPRNRIDDPNSHMYEVRESIIND